MAKDSEVTQVRPPAPSTATGGARDLARLEALAGALGPDSLGTLIEYFHAPHWPVRRRAAEIFIGLGATASRELRQRFDTLTEDQRHWAMWVVARVDGKASVGWLNGLYKSGGSNVRASVIAAVSELEGDEGVVFLMKALRDDSWLNRYAAAEALEHRGQVILEHLKRGLAEGVGDIKYWSLQLLVKIFGKGAAQFLRNLRGSDDPDLRHYAVRALAESDDEWAITLLVDFLSDPHWINRQAASRLLAAKGKRSVGPLLDALQGAAPDSAYWILKTLSASGDERIVRPVVSLLFAADGERAGEVREWAVDALAELRSEASARRLLEVALEFTDLRSRVVEALPRFGIEVLRPLLSTTLSPNPDVRGLAAQVVEKLPLQGVPVLVKALEARKRTEAAALLKGLAIVPSAQLEEILRVPEPDLGRLLALAQPGQGSDLSSIQRIKVAEPGERPAEGAASGARPAAAGPTGASYAVSLESVLAKAINAGASDIHLKAGLPPIFRIRGVLNQTDLPPLTSRATMEMARHILADAQLKTYINDKELDLSYEIEGVSRFRVNLFHDLCGPALVARVIPMRVPTLADLALPRVFKTFCNYTQGMILISGPTGAGKSTTLAAMIDYINDTREEHIITIEDPVEFRHANKKCLITNRELGSSTLSFAAALRSALREDPDIILVGELRDLETVNLAMIAAETGHLILSTLHTGTAGEAVERMINLFPGEQQGNARNTIAYVLRAVICQLLIPGVDGKPLPVFEILINNWAVSNLVRERKMNQLDQAIIGGRKDGMQSRDDHLNELCLQGRITPQVALEYALNRQELEAKLRKARP